MPRGVKGKKKAGKPKAARVELPKAIGVWVWAQCDNAGCQKWRKLPPGSIVNDKEPWFCYMNPNDDRNDCNISEESYNEATEGAVYSKEVSEDEEAESRDPEQWTPDEEPPSVKREAGHLNGRHTSGRGVDESSSPGQEAERPANGTWLAEDAREGRPAEGREGGGGSPQGFRGMGKARRAHTGFSKLLSVGGVWEITKGKGRAVTVPPAWVWEGLATHSSASAQLACQAADASSAARYFEMAQAPKGSQQAHEAASIARLALTAAAALAAQETGQIPGIEDSQSSDLAESPAADASGPEMLQPSAQDWSLQGGATQQANSPAATLSGPGPALTPGGGHPGFPLQAPGNHPPGLLQQTSPAPPPGSWPQAPLLPGMLPGLMSQQGGPLQGLPQSLPPQQLWQGQGLPFSNPGFVSLPQFEALQPVAGSLGGIGGPLNQPPAENTR